MLTSRAQSESTRNSWRWSSPAIGPTVPLRICQKRRHCRRFPLVWGANALTAVRVSIGDLGGSGLAGTTGKAGFLWAPQE
jgi:hypothetical protein